MDFPKFLGIAMETFLTMCDDTESDVRMVADECLNRSIKVKKDESRFTNTKLGNINFMFRNFFVLLFYNVMGKFK